MGKIPKILTVRCVADPDIGKASKEAHANMHRLVQAGYFDAAYRIAAQLLSPGPWRMSERSPLLYLTWVNLFWLGGRLGRDMTAFDMRGPMARDAWAWFQASRQPETKTASPIAFLFQEKPSRTDWSPDELDRVLATVRPDSFGSAFNAFQHDAEVVLRARLQARRPRSEQPTPARGDASRDHAAIADTVERGARIAFPRDVAVFAIRTAMPAAMLDVLDGNHQAATARLGRLLPKLKIDNQFYIPLYPEYFAYPAFGAWLASHALAPALGIDDAGVAAYLDAFAGRVSRPLAAHAPAAWEEQLAAYAKRLEKDGLDADALINNFKCGEPADGALLQLAERGKVLNAPCSDTVLRAAEARLGTTLPPSYREFLRASDGMVLPEFVSLLPASQIDWFRNLDRSDTIAIWNETDEEASDELYAIYGPDQDCIHMRPRHLRTALQVSTSCDGDVLLLIPEVRFGQEWEAWFFGPKNPGAYRFRSFRELMEQRVLALDD